VLWVRLLIIVSSTCNRYIKFKKTPLKRPRFLLSEYVRLNSKNNKNRCLNSRPSFSVFQKCVTVKKKVKQWQQVCVLLLLCVKRGAAWLSQMLGVCVSKHTKNLNGDLGRYAAPAVPAKLTLLGRNRCPLAGFRIGNLKTVVFRMLTGFPETGKE
jgi:hypothetical protein